MNSAQIEWIGWICVAFLGLTSLVWLLDMIGVVNIRSEGQRKILNRSIGGTFLASILSFVGANVLVGNNENTPAPIPTDVPTPGPTNAFYKPSDGDGSDPSLPLPLDDPLVDPIEGDTNGGGVNLAAPVDDALSPSVRTYLDQNGLVRPSVARNWRADYPQCAIRSRDFEMASPVARRCFGQLDRFNVQNLVPYQRQYDVYIPQISEISAALPAGALLEFLREDLAGYTRKTGANARIYKEASNELDADYSRLRRQAY